MLLTLQHPGLGQGTQQGRVLPHSTSEREGLRAGTYSIVPVSIQSISVPQEDPALLVTLRAELKSYTRLDVVFPLVSSRGK